MLKEDLFETAILVFAPTGVIALFAPMIGLSILFV
jgi:hypothetical protein